MKLSTRTRYGVKAMLELAEDYGRGPLRIKTIAQHKGVSAKYLEQLMAMLKSAGFVRGIRGSKGGYVLTRAPNQIKLSDVFYILEGPVIDTEGLEDGKGCTGVDDCVTRQLWAELQDAVMAVLQSVTLQDLVDRTKAKKNPDCRM